MVFRKANVALGAGTLVVGALGLMCGWSNARMTALNPQRWPISTSSHVVVSGTQIHVALGSLITSRTAKVGDVWHGTVTENVMAQDENLIPPGSEVEGVIADVLPAMEGGLAMLELGVQGIRINGRQEPITASADPVVSGSSRERQLGAGGPVARFPGHQVVLTDDTIMSFTVSRTVTVR